jgi:ABC-2 type transport system ATP-binding protein
VIARLRVQAVNQSSAVTPPGAVQAEGATHRGNAGSDAAGPAIETHGLVKRYGTTLALVSLSLTVARGEVFGFLGPNGSGKTTAVKILVGLTSPSGGSGRMLGAPLGNREARRRVGYLPELFRYQPWLRGREVLALHCELAGIQADRREDEIGQALGTVGLEDRGDALVGTYSKGMQQRLGLGVALLGGPEVVLLDEPTSALDPVGRQDVRAIIRELRARGATVFLNSHLLDEVERVCDRVAIVDRGRVVASESITSLAESRPVRVRASNLGDADRAALGAFGRVSDDGEWLAIDGISSDAVPDLVAAIVSRGGRVHAVLPGHANLERRFFEALGEGRDETGEELAP